MNQNIETGLLIAEVIKCNRDPEYNKSFIKYIVNKIIVEGNFKSTLFHQLVMLAENNQDEPEDGEEASPALKVENSN